MATGQLIVAVCVIVLCWRLLKKRKHLPNPNPGTRHPTCLTALPVVGSLPFLKSDTKELAHQLMETSESLGAIFALYLGTQYTVVLNSSAAIRDALVKKSSDIASRSQYYIEQNHLNTNLKGMAFAAYDDTFRRKHQTYLSILKTFGFGQRLMERRINDSVEEFVKQVQIVGGQPFDPTTTVVRSVVNIISSILIGRHFSYGHSTLDEIRSLTHDWISSVVSQVDFFPMLRFVPPYSGRMSWTIARHKLLLDTLDRTLSDVLATAADEDDNDSFVRQFVKSTGTPGVEDITFDREELLYTLRDFFAGGTGTSVTTIRWFLVLLANHREVQTRMRAEIDSVVGRDRLPSLDDERSMPYSQAVVLETMRRHTLGPLSMFRSTTCDTVIGDVFVPANTTIIVNLYSAHMDSTVWKDPTAFIPERFLDDDGAVHRHDHILPFGLGKRSCFAEIMARQELFLFMTGIVQNFDVCPPEGEQRITYEELNALHHEPTAFIIRMIPRIR